MMKQRSAPVAVAVPFATPVAAAIRRTGRVALAVVAVAGVLTGGSGVPAASSSGDASRAQQGTSGVTVFGDIDVSVSRPRTR